MKASNNIVEVYLNYICKRVLAVLLWYLIHCPCLYHAVQKHQTHPLKDIFFSNMASVPQIYQLLGKLTFQTLIMFVLDIMIPQILFCNFFVSITTV